MKIAVIGAGSWGTALGVHAARANHEIALWTRDGELAATINRERRHPRLSAVYELPDTLTATNDFNVALCDASLVLLALPSHATRETWRKLAGCLTRSVIVVSATKGIETNTGKRISEIIADESLEMVAGFVALSGPSFAEEVAANQPTAIVAASLDAASRDAVQRALSYGNFRVYTNDDLVGVELGGATKNTLALAAGMCAGLGLGSNSVAALITRGLTEMTRLALAYGAKPETLTGLAGLGDLVLTCTGQLSRNRHVGEQLGRGRTLDDILDCLTETAEGVRTTLAVRELAARRRIEMPITEQVYRVLYESAPVADAIGELMGRPLTTEFGGRQGV